MPLIDSHAHLDFEAFHDDFDDVMSRAHEAGVSKIMSIGVSLETSGAAVLLADNHTEIFASVGVHPEEANKVDFETIHNDLLSLAKSSKKVVGIGETGLDYYESPLVIPGSPRVEAGRKSGTQSSGALDPSSRAGMTKDIKEKQTKLFQIHIDVARHLGLPLIIHVRNGEDEQAVNDVYEIIRNSKLEIRNSSVAIGVIHCFTLDAGWAKRFADLGFSLGFTGIVTYKNALEIQNAVLATPLENILIETDCPFLTPQKYRGKRNEPAYVLEVAQKIAELKGITLDKVSEQTTINAEELFRI